MVFQVCPISKLGLLKLYQIYLKILFLTNNLIKSSEAPIAWRN
jgi:hypothetical protein